MSSHYIIRHLMSFTLHGRKYNVVTLHYSPCNVNDITWKLMLCGDITLFSMEVFGHNITRHVMTKFLKT
jgi:hypothetical protein